MPEARLFWLPLILAGGLIHLGLAAALVRLRTGPGSRTMGLTLAGIAVWNGAAAAEMLVPGQDAYFTAVAVKYTAIALTPRRAALHLSLQRAPRDPARATRAALPRAALHDRVGWTNPWHE